MLFGTEEVLLVISRAIWVVRGAPAPPRLPLRAESGQETCGNLGAEERPRRLAGGARVERDAARAASAATALDRWES
jgi:hypothetical protein